MTLTLLVSCFCVWRQSLVYTETMFRSKIGETLLWVACVRGVLQGSGNGLSCMHGAWVICFCVLFESFL